MMQLLEPRDEVMADKVFLIQDLLAPKGINVSPLLQSKSQMPTDRDAVATKKIAQPRVHAERAIGRVKELRILQNCPS